MMSGTATAPAYMTSTCCRANGNNRGAGRSSSTGCVAGVVIGEPRRYADNACVFHKQLACQSKHLFGLCNFVTTAIETGQTRTAGGLERCKQSSPMSTPGLSGRYALRHG